MNDYEVGSTHVFEGVPYVFLGGDPTQRSSWRGPDDPSPAQRRMAATGGSPLVEGAKDFGALALNVGSLGFADEAIGLVNQGAKSALRQRVADVRAEAPKGAVLAAEGAGAIAPALLGPVRAGVGAVRAGWGLGRATLLGGGAAAGMTALQNLGEQEGPKDVSDAILQPSTAVGGAIGGALGAAGPVANALLRRGPGRGDRLAAGVRATSGVRRKIKEAIRETRDEMKRISRTMFKPLDDKFAGGVMDNDIMDFVNSSPDYIADARAVSKELVPYTTELKAGTSRAARGPTVSELQKMRDRMMRRGDREGHAQLTQLMERALPGYAEANAAYAEQAAVRAARKAGRKMVNADADEIALAREALPPKAMAAFQEGQVQGAVVALTRRRGGTVGPVKALLNMGREYEDRMVEGVFRGDRKKFADFVGIVNRERSAERVAAELRKIAPWAVGGFAAGAGAAAATSLLR